MERLERLATVTLGCYMAGTGIRALAAGHPLYTNVLGEPAPAATAIVLGFLLLAVGVLWPRLRPRRR